LYAMTGTLNLADMAQKVAVAPAADAAVIRAGALLLLLVFATKAALFPLYFWLPRAYSAAEAPVAALFAIMTKVGVYAILRVATLVFGPESGVAAGVYEAWLLPVALMTVAIATFGVLAGGNLRTMAGYLNIASVGIICVGVGMFSAAAIAAALYYLLHSTLVISLLFLLIDLIRRRRIDGGDRIARGAAPAHPHLLGALFFATAVAVIGLPPLSGFLGKILLLQAAQQHGAAALIWAVVLGNALLALVAMARAGSMLFWHTTPEPAPAWQRPQALAADALPALLLLACIVALTVAAGPVADYAAATANQLLRPADYIGSVLQQPAATTNGEPR
jgi:multicomponent K+:H+ antiporter subunit D